MTVIDPPTRSRRKARPPRAAIAAAPRAAAFAKPVTSDDIARMHDLAERLGGRPVPRVHMTEQQFEAWCDEDVKAEWVDGEVVLMSPENLDSADLGGWLNAILRGFAEHHDLGIVIGREFTVRLRRQRRRRVPDLLFVAKARQNLIHPTFVDGAPDLIVEIVSPDSESRDWRDKYREYERAGVREYWVFDPPSRLAEPYALGKNKKYARLAEVDGRLESTVLPGFYFRPDWLRRPALPRVASVLKELGVRG